VAGVVAAPKRPAHRPFPAAARCAMEGRRKDEYRFWRDVSLAERPN